MSTPTPYSSPWDTGQGPVSQAQRLAQEAAAAVAGRAIYLQKPDAFWDFKKEVYANQDKITAFTFDDFARGFAEGHELDLKKYQADIISPDVQNAILAGVGAAFANDIRATPTYLVNGINVDPGNNGEALEAYAVRSASSVLAALAKRMPSAGHRKRDGQIADVPLDAVDATLRRAVANWTSRTGGCGYLIVTAVPATRAPRSIPWHSTGRPLSRAAR